MSDIIENSSMKNEKFSINFNQDYTSLSVVGKSGYRIFTLSSVDRVDEIFCSNHENTRIAERLFSSSLVAVVTVGEPNKLKVCHFKKGAEICNYGYPSTILTVKLNRQRLIVCLRDSIYIHNIRDMKLLHSIRHITPNESGLCTLSLNSQLAYPVSSTTGEFQIFDAMKLNSSINIKAHDSSLSAMNFSPDGDLIATASERGTVIRVFCVKNGQRVHEFRRGVKRNVRIASLMFSSCADYVCVSSNTETVHIFKIDRKAAENAQSQKLPSDNNDNTSSNEDLESKKPTSESRWSGLGFLTKAVSSYFPSQVSDVLSQDRAFATVQLAQPGLKYVCVLGKLEKQTHLLIASEDGFLYIYNVDETKGGECKLLKVHDLRNPLHDVTELGMNESTCDKITNTNGRSKSSSTYAGVLRGSRKDSMSADSDKCRDLSEAVDSPPKSIFDEVQFPPMTSVRE